MVILTVLKTHFLNLPCWIVCVWQISKTLKAWTTPAFKSKITTVQLQNFCIQVLKQADCIPNNWLWLCLCWLNIVSLLQINSRPMLFYSKYLPSSPRHSKSINAWSKCNSSLTSIRPDRHWDPASSSGQDYNLTWDHMHHKI